MAKTVSRGGGFCSLLTASNKDMSYLSKTIASATYSSSNRPYAII